MISFSSRIEQVRRVELNRDVHVLVQIRDARVRQRSRNGGVRVDVLSEFGDDVEAGEHSQQPCYENTSVENS